LPGKEGLVHISQLAPQRVERVEDVVKPGDQIMVKVIEIDSQGRINLSRKAVLGADGAAAPAPAAAQDDDGAAAPRSNGRVGEPAGRSGEGGGERRPRRRRPGGGSGE